jgi:DNA-binding transcriptional LysR family regulator
VDLTQLRTFVAVAEAGSVNRAAQALALSQPAVTRHVQRLETSLGVLLLDRRAKPVGLTAAGRIAVDHCRTVLRAMEALVAATAPIEGPSGDCRLGAAPWLADLALPTPLDHLRQRFPRLTMHVTTAWSRTLLDQLRRGALDAAIVHLLEGERLPAGVSGRPIGMQPLVFVAARREPVRSPLALDHVARGRWVLNPDGCGFRETLRRALQRIHASLHVAIEAYGAEAQLALVARGLGFGVVPARVLARSPERDAVQTFRVEGFEPRLTVWSARGRSRKDLQPVLDALDAQFSLVFEAAQPAASTHLRRRAVSRGAARAQRRPSGR